MDERDIKRMVAPVSGVKYPPPYTLTVKGEKGIPHTNTVFCTFDREVWAELSEQERDKLTDMAAAARRTIFIVVKE